MNETRTRIEERIERQVRRLEALWRAMHGGVSEAASAQLLKACGAELSRLCVEYIAAGGTRSRFVAICHETAGA